MADHDVAFDTASFWLTVCGAVCYLAERRRLAGICWIAVGHGYLGVIWERTCRTRLSGLRHMRSQTLQPVQLLIHSIIGVAGYRSLAKGENDGKATRQAAR